MNENVYSLVFLVRKERFEQEGLQEKISGELEPYIDPDNLNFELELKNVQIKIKGTTEEIEDCREVFIKTFAKQETICLLDELSDQLRKDTLPGIQKIDIKLRRLLKLAIPQRIGFPWWKNLPPEIRQTLNNLSKSDKNHSKKLDSLDLTIILEYFDKPPSGSDQSLSYRDLERLFFKNESVEEIKEDIKKKVPDTFLDILLKPYLGGQKLDKLKMLFNRIHPTYKKVKSSEVVLKEDAEHIDNNKDKVLELLKTAKSNLSNQETIGKEVSMSDYIKAYLKSGKPITQSSSDTVHISPRDWEGLEGSLPANLPESEDYFDLNEDL